MIRYESYLYSATLSRSVHHCVYSYCIGYLGFTMHTYMHTTEIQYAYSDIPDGIYKIDKALYFTLLQNSTKLLYYPRRGSTHPSWRWVSKTISTQFTTLVWFASYTFSLRRQDSYERRLMPPRRASFSSSKLPWPTVT